MLLNFRFLNIKNTIRSFQVFLYLVIWKSLMQILLLSWMIKNYKIKEELVFKNLISNLSPDKENSSPKLQNKGLGQFEIGGGILNQFIIKFENRINPKLIY